MKYVIKNNEKDATAQVRRALEVSDDIVFERGVYHFYPDGAETRVSYVSNHDGDGAKRIGMLIENRDGVTVDGGGSLFIFHGIMNPVSVINSRNITLKNFSVDYPMPMYAHAEVLENGEHFSIIREKHKNTLSVVDGRLFASIEGYSGIVKYTIEIDPLRDDIRFQSNDDIFGKWFEHMNVYAEDFGQGVFRMYGDEITKYPVVGDTLLLGFGFRFAPAIFAEESENLLFDGITVHHCLGMGILAQLSDNIRINNLTVTPSGDRFISAYADGVHFVNCGGEIILENSLIEKQMDDPLNCHGIYTRIEEIADEKTLVCRFVHCQQLGVRIYKKGDTVEFISKDTLLKKGEGVVSHVEYVSPEICKITLEDKIESAVLVGDAVEDISKIANLTVRGCVFRKNRARGLLITTRGRVLVENNVFDSNGYAVQIAGDANSWYESGCVRDVTIRKNKFINCGKNSWWGTATIGINPSIPKPGDECYHKNITVEDNEIYTFQKTVIDARSVENLTVKSNKIVYINDFPPTGRTLEKFVLNNCKNANLE